MYTDIFDDAWDNEMCAAINKRDQEFITVREEKDSQRFIDASWDNEMCKASTSIHKNLIESNAEAESLDQVPMDQAEMEHVPVAHTSGDLAFLKESKVSYC
jgi:hypothetical protein